MAEMLYGKPVALSLNEKIKAGVEKCLQAKVTPCLAVLRIGEAPGDLAYERSLTKKCDGLDIDTHIFAFADDVTQDEVLAQIKRINADSSIHGCLMFRPLPEHLDEAVLCNALAPEKDVDGITDSAMTGIFLKQNLGYAPCTAQACIELLDHYHIPIQGEHIAVIGRSLVVGKPLSLMLLNRNATVTICHSKTNDLNKALKNAKIVITAIGKAEAIGKDILHPGQILLDVGINFNAEGKMVGDTAFNEAEPILDKMTPVPGGIGAITTGVLALHVVEAAIKTLNEK